MRVDALPKPLPEGWIYCSHCSARLLVAALFTLRLHEPGKPHEARCALQGFMCPECMQPIWDNDVPKDTSPWQRAPEAAAANETEAAAAAAPAAIESPAQT